jgi:hypothetical protein
MVDLLSKELLSSDLFINDGEGIELTEIGVHFSSSESFVKRG